ncbi:MAG: MFS transporter [Geovibrio sp.]|nr:MFS transporter [Geovibrio sp.]
MENRKLFTALFIINFCITLGYGVVDSFFSLYVFELGARGALLGVPLAFYSVSKIFFSVPAGNAVSDSGAGRVLVLSVVCFCLVSCGYLFAGSVSAVVITAYISGCCLCGFPCIGSCCSGEQYP